MTQIRDTGSSGSVGYRVGRAVASGAVVGLLVLAACATGGPADQGSSNPTDSPTAASASTAPTPTPDPTGACATPTKAAAVYYVADVADVGPRLYREWARVATCEDPITEAVSQMFRVAPVDPDYTSLWSSSTKVVAVTRAGSTATVDVSAFPSLGAAFEGAAVQQLVWTATAADTSVKSVRLLVDGKVPDSGHHDWTNPVSRANALETLANVWILAPTQGTTVTSPVAVRIYGTGWEGYVPLKVYRGSTLVAETQVITKMGAFAEASTTISLPAGDYTLHAYNDNGRDASLLLWDTKDFTVQPTPTEQPTPPERSPGTTVVAPEPNANLTYQQAYLAAQAAVCQGCVRLNETPESLKSAARGLVWFDVRDVPPPALGGGALMLVGFDGTSWGVFATFHDSTLPMQLPADIWICVDDSGSNVRSGPGLQYPVLATVDSDQTVPATFFLLTAETAPGEGAGEGWFLIEGQGLAGWVSSTRVSLPDCETWRDFQRVGELLDEIERLRSA